MIKSSATQKTLPLNPMFESDALTSPQYFKVFQQNPGSHPERRLMLAVFSDAIECFQKYFRSNNRRGRKLSLRKTGSSIVAMRKGIADAASTYGE